MFSEIRIAENGIIRSIHIFASYPKSNLFAELTFRLYTYMSTIWWQCEI